MLTQDESDKIAEWALNFPSDAIKSRWMILTHCQPEDLSELHSIEMGLGPDSRNVAHYHPRSLAKLNELIVKNNLKPWFIGEPTGSEQLDAKSKFLAQIYCIWAPRARRYGMEAWGWESENQGVNGYTDVKLLHILDKAIYDSGFKPQRIFETVQEKKVAEARKRGMSTLDKIQKAVQGD